MFQQDIFRRYRYQGLAYVYAGAKKHRRGKGSIVTAGSTTTVTSADRAFQDAIAGDEIRVKVAGVTHRRVIVTWTSANSVVVDQNVSIPAPAKTWDLKPQRAGILDTDGWVNVMQLKNKLLYVELNTKGSTSGITYSLEGRGDGVNQVPRELITGTLTAAVVAGTTNPAAADTVVVPERVTHVRLGIKNDNVGLDIVSAWITGDRG